MQTTNDASSPMTQTNDVDARLPPVNPLFDTECDDDTDATDLEVECITVTRNDLVEIDSDNGEGPQAWRPVRHAAAVMAYAPDALQGGKSKFEKSISQPDKKEDDSSVSFGDKVAQTIGNFQYAPSAPIAGEEQTEYEEWLRATTIADRGTFPKNEVWTNHLVATGTRPGFTPTVELESLPVDAVSAAFEGGVKKALEAKYQEDGHDAGQRSFLLGDSPTDDFSNFRHYVPPSFAEEGEAAWLNNRTDNFDEVHDMIAAAHLKYGKVSWRDPTKNVVPADRLWVVSDHNGESTGKQLEVWGPGNKPRFFKGPLGKKWNRVHGVESVALNSPYSHCPGRFTVAYIQPNELGFLWHKATSEIQIMLPGRYFVRELTDSYIGKAPVSLGLATKVTAHTSCRQSFVQELAARLEVVSVAAGHSAFVMTGEGIIVAPHRLAAWIVDHGRDEEFVSMARLSKRVSSVKATVKYEDQEQKKKTTYSYSIVNVQPDEYIVFKDSRSRSIVWGYHHEDHRLNSVHLNSLYFKWDGVVHKITEGSQQLGDVAVLYNRPQDFCVILDPVGNPHFLEGDRPRPFTLRAPWRLVESAPRSRAHYKCELGEGRCVSRLLLAPSEWAVVQTHAGEIKFYPPLLLKGQPYYFYQPYHTVFGIVNRFASDEQKIVMPGYDITIVNLSTGELGACCIQNVNMFLNPRPMNPYVFVSPDRFLGKCKVEDSHFEAGDLHYVRVNSDERMCVIRDGQAMLLPSDDDVLAKANKGNGVYIFRARQKFEVIGPHKKVAKEYKLGPWQFFNVPPGHVGYGTKEGKLFVWGEGQGVANTSNNEQFIGFFQTTVDPVVKGNVEVMCRHAITSKLKITVTYSIEEPAKTIKLFSGDHEKLHKFVESLAVSKILELCAKRPPMGFSESDFDPRTEQEKADYWSSLSDEEKKEIKESTDKSKVSGELLSKLRQHPEVIRAGIHIGFAEIQEWQIDERFMQSSKEIAMELQQTHAITERKRMELAQQKLDNQRAVEDERSRIEQDKLKVEQERLKCESMKEQAAIAARQQAETLEAETVALNKQKIMQEEAKCQSLEMAARAERAVALQHQERQAIENSTNIARAESEAAMRVAAESAEYIARANAEKQTARLQLEAAQMQLEAAKIRAEAELATATAKARGEQLLGEAKIATKFPGLTGAELAECLLEQQRMEVHCRISQRTQQVVHTMDPAEAQKMFDTQVQNLYGLQMSMRGFSPLVPQQRGVNGMGGMGMHYVPSTPQISGTSTTKPGTNAAPPTPATILPKHHHHHHLDVPAAADPAKHAPRDFRLSVSSVDSLYDAPEDRIAAVLGADQPLHR